MSLQNNVSSHYEPRFGADVDKDTTVMVTETDSIIDPTPDSPGYARESTLVRGLQVPAKSSRLTSGFKYPSILARADVSKESWTAFNNEISDLAGMTASQWLNTIGGALGTFVAGNLIIGFFGLIPAVVVGRKMRKHREEQNLLAAERSGALMKCVKRWNENYFQPRGLVVRVDVPGEVFDMADMDVSTSKQFKLESVRAGSTSALQMSDPKQRRSSKNDTKARKSAALKGRIVIIPLKQSYLGPNMLQRDGVTEVGTSDGADDMSDEDTEFGDEDVSMFGPLLGSKMQKRDMYPDEPKP